jgi:hypothetical protein
MLATTRPKAVQPSGGRSTSSTLPATNPGRPIHAWPNGSSGKYASIAWASSITWLRVRTAEVQQLDRQQRTDAEHTEGEQSGREPGFQQALQTDHAVAAEHHRDDDAGDQPGAAVDLRHSPRPRGHGHIALVRHKKPQSPAPSSSGESRRGEPAQVSLPDTGGFTAWRTRGAWRDVAP